MKSKRKFKAKSKKVETKKKTNKTGVKPKIL